MGNKIYLIGHEKGGVGKTTLAFNLAILRAKAGKPVLLVDTDRQRSSSMWATMRAEAGHQPPLLTIEKRGSMIGVDLIQLRQNYELIVDAGGADSVEMRQSIAVADKWILPVRPSQLDLFAMAKMAQLQIDVEERIGHSPECLIVLNAVNSSTREGAETRELLDGNPKMQVIGPQLVDRVAQRRAVMMGCGLLELTGKDASPAANTELLRVYEAVFGEPYVEA